MVGALYTHAVRAEGLGYRHWSSVAWNKPTRGSKPALTRSLMKSLNRPPPSTPASSSPHSLTNITRSRSFRSSPNPFSASKPSSMMWSRRIRKKVFAPIEERSCRSRTLLRSAETSIWNTRARSVKGTMQGAWRRSVHTRLEDASARSQPPRLDSEAATSAEKRSPGSPDARKASGGANLRASLRSCSCLSSRPAANCSSARSCAAGAGQPRPGPVASVHTSCHNAALSSATSPAPGAPGSYRSSAGSGKLPSVLMLFIVQLYTGHSTTSGNIQPGSAIASPPLPGPATGQLPARWWRAR
mmetsp:Transcript_19851/g.49962  ORF Transcript_19851/g.49962 Transcript_19851/m.49962 type:complete len:300 (+) Transcript_19851:999-1898(+)